jgi:hypothetical protein
MDVRPVLTRLDVCFASARSGDGALVPDMSSPGNPASKAMIYRQGATTSASISIPVVGSAPTPVAVYDSGGCLVGSSLQVGKAPGWPVLNVTAVTPTQISVTNSQALVFAIPANTRLIVLQPMAPLCQSPIGTDQVLTNEGILQGPYARLRGYVAAGRYDLIRVINGTYYELYQDMVGGFVVRG